MALHQILTTFLDGRNSYVAGELRHFDEEPTEFAKAGWVYVDGVTPDDKVPTEFNLDVHNGVLGTADNAAEVTHG